MLPVLVGGLISLLSLMSGAILNYFLQTRKDRQAVLAASRREWRLVLHAEYSEFLAAADRALMLMQRHNIMPESVRTADYYLTLIAPWDEAHGAMTAILRKLGLDPKTPASTITGSEDLARLVTRLVQIYVSPDHGGYTTGQLPPWGQQEELYRSNYTALQKLMRESLASLHDSAELGTGLALPLLP